METFDRLVFNHYSCQQRMAIRNVGHFEAPTYQVAKPFIKCYVVQI